MKDMGLVIKGLRRGKKIRQHELSETLGCTAAYLSMVEHGVRHLRVDVLLRLLEVLGVNPVVAFWLSESEGKVGYAYECVDMSFAHLYGVGILRDKEGVVSVVFKPLI